MFAKLLNIFSLLFEGSDTSTEQTERKYAAAFGNHPHILGVGAKRFDEIEYLSVARRARIT